MSEQDTSQDTSLFDSQNTWSTNFALTVRIRGSFSDEQLRLALARVRAGHPSLLQRQGESGYMEAISPQDLPEFPLEMHMGCSETDWIDVTRAELSRQFPPEGPMVRFILLRLPQDRADLVAVFHHWVADGMSGVYVIRDTLLLMADPEAELSPATIPPKTADVIPKAVRQDARTRSRVWRELNRLRSSMSQNHPDVTSKPVFSEQEVALKREICLAPGSLSAQQTTALLARCRAEGTSVHAAICVAWLRAYAESLEGPKRWMRTASSPVNVRNRLAQPIPETSGGFICIVNTRVNCAPARNFWQVAREFKQRLADGMVDHRLLVPELTMTKIPTSFPESQIFQAFERYFSNGSNHYDFSITNLGQVDIPPAAGPLTVEAFYGPLVNSMENERTVGVSTFAGKLSFALLFRRSLMDPAWAAQLLERAVAHLEAAVVGG